MNTSELKIARIKKGLSQAEASKLLGVTNVTLSKWENGKSSPNWKYVEKMKKIYGEESIEEYLIAVANSIKEGVNKV